MSQKVKVIAHRGASGYAPENTRSSVVKAIELKSHYIEVDVHMTKDEEVVLFHDDKLGRTTNGTGRLKKSTLKELKLLDAGSWFSPKFKGERIITLKELLEIDFKDSNLIIEVKNVNNVYKGIEKKILDIVQSSPFKSKVIYKSFSSEVLEKFKELDPYCELLYVTIGPIPFINFLIIDDWLRFGSLFDFKFANYIQVHRLLITQKIVDEAHALNKEIVVWGVNTLKEIKEMQSLNVDLIETDFPDRVNVHNQ